ncbi:MAG: YtxH domain-containing protein [Chloroflexota bacterium]|nr:YtxH domain-containing protein [Chloroflexota bacterium]
MVLRVARASLKYFVFGLVAGLFFAPRRGDETRRSVLDWVGNQTGRLIGVQPAGQPAGQPAEQQAQA